MVEAEETSNALRSSTPSFHVNVENDVCAL
jgi:hypothetical protein